MKKIFFSFLILTLSFTNYAQYQSLKWYIGPEYVLDFSSTMIQPGDYPEISYSGEDIASSTAIVSDLNPDVEVAIYFKDGEFIFPNTPNTISAPAGTTPAPNQPAYILGQRNSNFDFNTLQLATNGTNRYSLYYSEGEINAVPSVVFYSINTDISNNLSSKMAIFYDGAKPIVLTHELGNDQFNTYNNLPDNTFVSSTDNVIYGANIGEDYDSGFMKFTNDGYNLAVSSPDMGYLQVFNFDLFNSIINYEIFNYSALNFNAIEFSAGYSLSGKRILYAATTNEIYQITFSDSELIDVVKIGESSNNIISMQLATDGKIYVGKEDADYLGVIYNPEIRGTDCFYDDNGIYKPAAADPSFNGILPNIATNYLSSASYLYWFNEVDNTDTLKTNEKAWFYYINSHAPYEVTWEFGDGNTATYVSATYSNTYTLPGTYNLVADGYFIGHPFLTSQRMTKKVIVNPQPYESILNVDTLFSCDNGTKTTLWANYNPNNFLVWKDGNEQLIDEGIGMTSMDVYTAGTYYLECYDRENGVLVHKDTATIIDILPDISATPTNDINPNENITFNANITQIPLGAIDLADIDFNWDMGEGTTFDGLGLTSINHTYTSVGTYSVTLSIDYEGECYTNTISTIEVVPPTGIFIDPSEAELCPGSSVTLSQIFGSGYWYEWYDDNHILIEDDVEFITVDTYGKYFLEIYDTQGGNLILEDSTTVYSLTVFYETISAINNSVYDNFIFEASLQQYPEEFVLPDTLFFEWDFSEGEIVSGEGLTIASHNFLFPQTYTTSLFVETDYCTYSNTVNYNINSDPAPITPNEAMLCDVANPVEFEFISDYQNYDCNIYYNESFIGQNSTNNTISINQAGEYRFEIFIPGGDTIAYDTITIFEYNNDFTATGDDALPNTIFNIGENVFFNAIINEYPYNFIDDYSNIYFVWTVNGFSAGFGYGEMYLDSIFSTSGVYEVNLQTIYNSCERNFSQEITIEAPNLISPHDTIICDYNENVILSIGDEYINDYVEWTDTGGSLFLFGLGEIQYEFSAPGEYVVRVFSDEFATDTLNIDTARIYWLDPDFSVLGSFFVGEQLTFVTNYNSIPSPYNYFHPINFDWDMDDGTNYNDTFLETILHSYSESGTYDVNLDLSTDFCNYTYSKAISILDAPTTVQIYPQNAMLCDLYLGEEIELSVNVSSYDYEINWYRTNFDINYQSSDIEQVATDTSKTIINSPGTYFVEVVGSDNVYYDSIRIDYKHCNNYDADLSVNGISGQSQICLSTAEVLFDIYLTDLSTNCTPDFNTFNIVWDFGDGVVESGEGLVSSNHTYSEFGNYLVSAYIFDNKNCEKVIRKRVKVFSNSDTAIIYSLNEVNPGDIEIDITQIPELYLSFNTRSTFMSDINAKIYPYNWQSFSLDVAGSQFETIQDPNDVMLYLKLSQAGNFNVTLKPPLMGTEIYAVNTNATQSTYLFGYPALKSANFNISKTNSYILSSNNDLPIQNINGDYHYEYFSVDSLYAIPDFHYFNSGYYKSDQMYNTQDEYVNGTWELLIEGTSSYTGRIESWGLIFKNSYFNTQISPDSMVCSDQFGNQYNVHDNIIMLNNSGVTEYNITCELKYPNSNCVITKEITVLLPDTPPIQEYFSPNDDGINDYWLPVSPDANAHIVIIDKSGNVVADYNSKDNYFGWDGTFNGKKLPSNSYWYLITLPNNHVVKGVVTIVR